MTIQIFRQLLEKWKKHECSPEEEKLLMSMFSGSEQKVKELMISEIESLQIKESNNDADLDALLDQIKYRIHQQSRANNRMRNRSIEFARIAAIVIAALVTGGILSYVLFSSHPTDQASVFQIKAPYGARSELTLPDGSCVWLNAGSSIRYDNGFNKQNRTLYLAGEGYFKVAKNKHLPFVVQTSRIHINAVGTEFNVKAYEDENTIETTLVEGKITLQEERNAKSKGKKIYLEPNQKAVYLKKSGNFSANPLKKITGAQSLQPVSTEQDMFIGKAIDPTPDIAWKENKLIFKSTELEDMAATLERKYNINVRFGSEEVKKIRFTGTLKDETLQQILDVIKLTAPISYSLKGKQVTIYENMAVRKEFLKYLKKR